MDLQNTKQLNFLEPWINISDSNKQELASLGLDNIDNYIEIMYPHSYFLRCTPDELVKRMKEYHCTFGLIDKSRKIYGFLHKEGFRETGHKDDRHLTFHSVATVLNWFNKNNSNANYTNPAKVKTYIESQFTKGKIGLESTITSFSNLSEKDRANMTIY